MVQILNSFVLMVRLNFKRGVYLWQLISLLLLACLISTTNLPDREHPLAGISLGESLYAEEILDHLLAEEGLFRFVIFESESLLEEALLHGQISSGLVFVPDFDQRIQEARLEGSIQHYTNSLNPHSILLEETVYAAFFRIYGPMLFANLHRQIYSDSEPTRDQALQDGIESMLEGGQGFQIQTIMVDCLSDDSLDDEIYPLQGSLGLMIFLNLYFAYGRKFDPSQNAIDHALNPRERLAFNYIYGLARLVFLGPLCLMMIGLSPSSRGFIQELTLMLFLLFLGPIYVLFYGHFFKRDLAFIASFLPLIVLNLVLCPIFFDLSSYLPFLRYLSYLSPLGIYLN